MITGILTIIFWILGFYLKHFRVNKPNSNIKNKIKQTSKQLVLAIATQASPYLAFVLNICACFSTSGLNQLGFQWLLVIMPWAVFVDYILDSFHHQEGIKSAIKNHNVNNNPQEILSPLMPFISASSWFAIGFLTSLIVLQIIF